ncbi:hypothetical protein ACFQ8C_09395 [Streptomyces sp. NPDC056503]|uniref:hypothetical protein n=1 Tax=Streptomyces sp. NPDC056503 TaxID=3345842 RepID=UPI0036A17023
MKLSSAKVTAPGPKQVLRGPGARDVLALANGAPPEGAEPLLRTVMRGRPRTGPADTLAAARARFEEDLALVPDERFPRTGGGPDRVFAAYARDHARSWGPDNPPPPGRHGRS